MILLSKESELNPDKYFEDLLSRREARDKFDPHPPTSRLFAYYFDILDDRQARAVEFHLNQCRECKKQYEEIAERDAQFKEDLKPKLSSFEELKRRKRKREIYRATKEFINRFYPGQVDFLKEMWGFLKDRDISDLATYGMPSAPSPLGAFGISEDQEEVQASLTTLSLFAALLEEEELITFQEVDKLSSSKREELVNKFAKQHQASKELKEELSQFLGC